MFKHLLVATDGSPFSEQAARKALQFAKALSARVTALTVSVPFHVFASDAVMVTDTKDLYDKDCAKRAEGYLAPIRKEAEAAGLHYEGKHVFQDHPYAAIIDIANASGCDAICMASHGRRGLAALVLGSQTVDVLTHSRLPVIVWR